MEPIVTDIDDHLSVTIIDYTTFTFSNLFQDRRSKEGSRQASTRRVHLLRQNWGCLEDLSHRWEHLSLRRLHSRVRRRHCRSVYSWVEQTNWQTSGAGRQRPQSPWRGCQAHAELRNKPEAHQSWTPTKVICSCTFVRRILSRNFCWNSLNLYRKWVKSQMLFTIYVR